MTSVRRGPEFQDTMPDDPNLDWVINELARLNLEVERLGREIERIVRAMRKPTYRGQP